MKKEITLWILRNSYLIIKYTFWVYFLFIIGIDLFSIPTTGIVAFLFWLLLGIYLGYSLAILVIKRMENYRNTK